MYAGHYLSLVRLAILMVSDDATAEEIVQDSFIAMHSAWHRLRDNDKALSYLRQSVVNRSRSVLRHRTVVGKNASQRRPDYLPEVERGALSLLERSAVIAALRTLPPRQREALALRFYANLSEAQIATAMGISRGAVKSHTARGIAALRVALELDSGAADEDADYVEYDRYIYGQRTPSSQVPPLHAQEPIKSPEPSPEADLVILVAQPNSHLPKILSWRWWLSRVLPKPAADVLSATRQELLGRAWRELEQEIGAFYRELGPPPGFEAGGNRG